MERVIYDEAGVDREMVGVQLVKALTAILSSQLQTGEIPTYQRNWEDRLEYRLSPFISTFVYEALASFDPRCHRLRPHFLDLVPAPQRHRFARLVTHIRRRIRGYIAWQEESDGVWRFFGRGSGLDADADDTACAAAVLLDGGRLGFSAQGRNRHVAVLRRFRTSDGIYCTWWNPDHGKHNGVNPEGQPYGFDRIVNANVARYLALAGEDVRDLGEYLRAEIDEADFRTGSPYYPNPLCFFYTVARVWHEAQLPGMAQVTGALVPAILALQKEEGAFGGPLDTALALSALLDLGYMGPALLGGMSALMSEVQPWGGWLYQDFFISEFGSPACTTALAMNALAQCCSVLVLNHPSPNNQLPITKYQSPSTSDL